MVDPSTFLTLVVDADRLAVLGAAARGPVDVDDLAAELGIDRRKVLEAVGRLRTAGLIDGDLTLDRGALRSLAESLPGFAPPDDQVLAGEWTVEERDILRRFFEGPRLVQIPTARSKRLVILERLCQEFEPGIRYTEREVDSKLHVFHPDHASLRRYLVDEALLSRADGYYWRSGGRVD